jgi:3-methyladenine DNA glycosylase Tag
VRKDNGLDPHVLNWISRIVKTQQGTHPEKMAEELKQRGFAFTSSAQEASLTPAAPIIKPNHLLVVCR